MQEKEDMSTLLPNPPNTMRDETHLIELLLEGLKGSKHEVTEETWKRRRQEIHRRYAARDWH